MQNSKSPLVKLLMVAAAGLSLAACQHGSVTEPAASETVMRNEVKMVRLPFTIKAEDDGTTTPSSYTLAGVNLFLRSVNAGHADVILLDAPNVDQVRIDEIAAYIKRGGFVYGGTSTLGAAPVDGEITLYLERHIVVPPNCGFWRRETSSNDKNNASSFHGCASMANLGMMIANPRDLIAGQGNGNSTTSAVGALYSPTPQTSGPTITMSLDGIANMPTPTTSTAPSGGGDN